MKIVTGDDSTVVIRGNAFGGMQLFPVEAGKLAETWFMFQQPGSAWPDTVAQEKWTSPSPIG
jgi:hypothetical protein